MSDMNQGPGGFGTSGGTWPAPPGGGSVAPRTSSLAITSLITGILSIVLCPAFGIVGLITGYSAKRKIRESNGAETGEGLATGGIVTSYIGIIFIGLAVLAIIAITFLGTAASSKFVPVGSSIR